MDERKCELGKIVMLDNTKQTGVIKSNKTKQLYYFHQSDVEIGKPREGEEVQFIIVMSDSTAVAKKIVVLADAARLALKSLK